MNNHLALSLLAGILPTFVWLFFWLREDKERPEPKGLLLLTFFAGMLTVIFVLPFEELARTKIIDDLARTFSWATAEELIKYAAVAFIALKSRQIDEPIDFPIYFITAALGFAALENTLFLLKPFSLNATTEALLTGNLRFLGATLLHAVCSAMIGIGMGLTFYSSWTKKKIGLFVGILAAIILHSLFNFFIIKTGDSGNFFAVFGALWVVTIITMLLFEKLRRMGEEYRSLRKEEENLNYVGKQQ